jgi:hypothetical protein
MERVTTLERGSEYRSRKGPWSGTSLDDVELGGTPKVIPHLIEVVTEDQPEERTDFG